MKRYVINKPVMLSFLTSQDQYDRTIKPDTGFWLELEGNHTIWLVSKDGTRRESITTANAITLLTEQGTLEELLEDFPLNTLETHTAILNKFIPNT